MTMPGTLDVLQQMLDTLKTLEVELENEQSLLCAGRVDAVRLQAATLEKRICSPRFAIRNSIVIKPATKPLFRT